MKRSSGFFNTARGFKLSCRSVLASFAITIILISSVPALLSSMIPSVNAQVEDDNTDLPYLVVLPEDNTLNAAEHNSFVDAFGRNFCPEVECSEVELTVGNEFSVNQVATADVAENGTFAVSFRINASFPGLYNITASQTAADGSILSAFVPIIVPIGDALQPEEPPIEIESTDNAGAGGAEQGLSLNANSIVSSAAISGVTEFPPNVDFSGRAVAVDTSPTSDAVAIVASESGGLWKTTDSGSTWSHLDGLVPFRMSDVKFAPGNDQVVIATAWASSHATNGGGIYRSIDGGATWSKPPTADPTPGVGCPALFTAWGISFATGTNDVFVGTDCGVAVSHDLGATWNHVVPDPSSSNHAVYGIFAQQGGPSGSIVDTCAADGHHRSTDGGATWTSANTLPNCPYAAVHSIVGSPLESDVLFAAIDSNTLFESDDGGATWTNLNPAQGSSRPVWVAVHVSADGDPNHLDLYFSGGLRTARQTCDDGPLNGSPGLRCSTSWTMITTGHGNFDQNGMSFGTSDNCAKYLVNDGGVEITTDCGANWSQTGNGAGGFHALQVYEMTGQVHPDHTDLYFGTQDNLLWASGDNGVTWPNKVFWEGWFIQVPRSSPTHTGQTVAFVAAGPPRNSISGEHFSSSSWGGWNNPPGGMGSPFVIEDDVYIQWNSSGPTFQLHLTTDTGATWTPVNGATTNLNLVDHPFIAGPAANPTVYQIVQRPGGAFGLIQITGVRTASATVTDADSGLGSIGSWVDGQGAWRGPYVFGVDPSDPQHLIAADAFANKMMVSTDGGATWNPDNLLTTIVTNFGQFAFDLPTSLPGIRTQAHTIAFDPTNGSRILVGTEHAGIFGSTDGGATWGFLPGSEMIPAVTSFFFDDVQNEVMASSYGRGLWKLNMTELQIIKLPIEVTTTLVDNATGLALQGNPPVVPAGVAIRDTVSFNVTDASGFVDYVRYDTADCSGPSTPVSTAAVTNSVAPPSDPVAYAVAGNYSWQAFYRDDNHYLDTPSTCEPLVVVSLEVSKGFARPLVNDTAGVYHADVVLGGKSKNVVSSTNPGEIRQQFNITSQAQNIPIKSINATDTLPINWNINPIQGAGAVRVLFQSAGSDTLKDITKSATINLVQATNPSDNQPNNPASTPAIVTIEIHDLTASSSAGKALEPGDRILVSVKLQYGLKGITVDPLLYPVASPSTADVTGYTDPSFAGTAQTVTGDTTLEVNRK